MEIIRDLFLIYTSRPLWIHKPSIDNSAFQQKALCQYHEELCLGRHFTAVLLLDLLNWRGSSLPS